TQLLTHFDDKREGMTWFYLLTIANNKGEVTSSIYAIANALKIHRQTLSRIIKHLALTGWVDIEEDEYHTTVTYPVAEDVTSHVTDDVADDVADDVTNHVTDDVTNHVTDDVTSRVTDDVTDDVTFSDAEKECPTFCVSGGCQLRLLEGVTLPVTPPVTLSVTNKEEKKQKKEEFPPAPPKEEKKQKKEKTTHTNVHACEKKPEEKLAERRQQFLASLTPYHERYGKEMVTQFGDYWTEPNRSLTKMRFELQRTWSTTLRLATWARNDKIFTHNHNNHDKTTRPTAAEFIADAQRTAIEETERFIREAEIRRGGIPPHLPF
ncbi:MAG: MarR family transcriptional regulator, partial [Prevotella sp.]|nr:MarR family transcriptional regulator [Prevotella sp.]